jgi:hypothetical protein
MREGREGACPVLGNLGAVRRAELSFVGQKLPLDEKVSIGVWNITSLYQQRKRSNPILNNQKNPKFVSPIQNP